MLSVAEVAAANRGAVVRVDVGGGCGGGFIVNSEGYLVTNEHVVTTSNEVSVRMDGDVIVAGTVIARDATHDIALVKIASGSHPTVSIGSSDEVLLGAALTIMWHPLCLPNVTVTTGILSSQATLDGLDFIQTDATVNPGNSGGAAFDSRGALIGIPVFKFVGEAIENTNFLIPMNRVRPAVDSWIEQHRAGTLGATTAPEATTPTRDPVLVYERDSLVCGGSIGDSAAGTAFEWVPVVDAEDFIMRFDVVSTTNGLPGLAFRGTGDSAGRLIFVGQFTLSGTWYDILYMFPDAGDWVIARATNSGLAPSAPPLHGGNLGRRNLRGCLYQRLSCGPRDHILYRSRARSRMLEFLRCHQRFRQIQQHQSLDPLSRRPQPSARPSAPYPFVETVTPSNTIGGAYNRPPTHSHRPPIRPIFASNSYVLPEISVSFSRPTISPFSIL